MSLGHEQLDVYRVAIELECGAAQDALEACGAISPQANAEGKQLLDRIVAMLTRFGRRGYAPAPCRQEREFFGYTRAPLPSSRDPGGLVPPVKEFMRPEASLALSFVS